MPAQKAKDDLKAAKVVDTKLMTISFISDSVVLVRAKPEVNIDKEQSSLVNKLIEDTMPNDYGMIIDREADYSIMPVEVFGILNKIKTLKAIAIVVHRDSSAKATAIDKLLFKGHLKVFFSIPEAYLWMNETLELDNQ
ncbi:MAG: hypothetical protein ACRBCS_05280 [Cellvibrionaceae bacterium]